jgi:exodeoxyribonuclease V gamma subunit
VLLDAWQQGLRRPLPLAVKSGYAWLAKGGRTEPPPGEDALKAARVCYEQHDPGWRIFGERDSNPYLARAFPDFNTLWADGEFARLADALLRPLHDALGNSRSTAAEGVSA